MCSQCSLCTDSGAWESQAKLRDLLSSVSQASSKNAFFISLTVDPSREAEPLGEEAVEAVEVDLGTKIELRINTTAVRATRLYAAAVPRCTGSS